MKILSFLLSTALVASSFGIAAAGNGVGHGPVDQSPVGWTRLASILTSGSSAGFATDAQPVDALMLQLTPQSRIFVATEAVDFRKGIDGLAAICRRAVGGIRIGCAPASASCMERRIHQTAYVENLKPRR